MRPAGGSCSPRGSDSHEAGPEGWNMRRRISLRAGVEWLLATRSGFNTLSDENGRGSAAGPTEDRARTAGIPGQLPHGEETTARLLKSRLSVQSTAPTDLDDSASSVSGDGEISSDAPPRPRSLEDLVQDERVRRNFNHVSLAWQRRPSKHGQFTHVVRKVADSIDEELFVSHCWTSPEEIQARKWELLQKLSESADKDGPGFTYWADFLDMDANGPEPWVSDIEDGIRAATKMVCFIDEQYLCTFRCLQEAACAIKCGKAIVPVIMDQKAWTFLTVTKGAELVWEQEQLRRREGELLAEETVFSLESLKDLFFKLSSINFCPCRDLELQYMGQAGMMQNFWQYVGKDIPYLKEHAELEAKGINWEKNRRTASALLHRDDIVTWRHWTQQALRARLQPAPTKLQLEYVQSSRARERWIRLSMWTGVASVLAALLVAAILSVFIYLDVMSLAQHARHQELVATVLLLGRSAYPETSREMRSLLRAGELAQDHNVTHTVLPSVQEDGHQDWVRGVAMSHDGLKMASASGDGTIKMWYIEENGAGRDVPAHFAEVTTLTCPPVISFRSVAWSPESALVAGGAKTGELCVWFVGSGLRFAAEQGPLVLQGHTDQVWALDFHPSPAGSGWHLLASGSDDSTFRLWGVEVHPLGNALSGASLAADTPSFDNSGCAIPWEANLTALVGIIKALKWSPDGAFLAAGCREAFVSLYSFSGGQVALLGAFPTPVKDLRSLAFSPHPSRPWLFVAGKEAPEMPAYGGVFPIFAYDFISVADGTEAAPQPAYVLLGHTGEIRAMSWLGGASRLVSAGTDFILRFWEVPPPPPTSPSSSLEEVCPVLEIPSHARLINSVSASEWRLAAGTDSSDIGMYEFDYKELSPTVQSSQHLSCGGQASGASWARQGHRAALGLMDGQLCFFTLVGPVTPQLAGSFAGCSGAKVDFLAWAPDGVHLASTSADGRLQLWLWPVSFGSPTLLHHLEISGPAVDVSFSLEGRQLAALDHSSVITVIDAANSALEPEILWRFQSIPHLHRLCWGPGGILAAGGTGSVWLWGAAGQVAGEEPAPAARMSGFSGSVRALSISRDGAYLAAAASQLVHLWHLEMPEGVPHVLQAHSGLVTHLDFYDDSEWLVSSSETDSTIRMWDLKGPAGLDCGSAWYINEAYCHNMQYLSTGHVVCQSYVPRVNKALGTLQQPESPSAVDAVGVTGSRFTVRFSEMLGELDKMTYGQLIESDLIIYGYDFLNKPGNGIISANGTASG